MRKNDDTRDAAVDSSNAVCLGDIPVGLTYEEFILADRARCRNLFQKEALLPRAIRVPIFHSVLDERYSMRRLIVCCIWCMIFHVGCRDAEVSQPSKAVVPQIRFTECASLWNVSFHYRNSHESEMSTILESLGGGVGIFDFDQDGKLDLFFAGGGHISASGIRGEKNGLFRQDTGIAFQRCDEPAGLQQAVSYSHGVTIHDVDNDGFTDVLLTGYGALTLFLNQGDGSFLETANSAGLTEQEWSSSAVFGDVTGDGIADLYVVRYADWSLGNHPVCMSPDKRHREICPPRSFSGITDDFYTGNGDGRFLRKSLPRSTPSKGLGAIMVDLDLDSDLDLYVANDTDPNFLYSNDGGELTEIGWRSGTAVGCNGAVNGSMGVDCGDLNLDGKPDLWVTNYEHESICFYANIGDLLFQELSTGFGLELLSTKRVGWGTVLADFDNDGDEDAFVANGHVIKYPAESTVLQTPWLLSNKDGAQLLDASAHAGDFFHTPHSSRGVSAGDIDEDGDIDLIISSLDSSVAVLRNESENPQRKWIGIRLIGKHGTRIPTGTVVEIHTDSGRVILRQLKNGGSFASASSEILHFGLGEIQHIEKAVISWPNGDQQILVDLPLNRTFTVIEGRQPY